MYDKSKSSFQLIAKKSHSKRNRNRGRQLKTYNNKLTKLKSRYSKLLGHSQKSKALYLEVKEADRKPKEKVFFCDKYPDFQKFLAVNKLRPMGREEAPVSRTVARPKPTKVWGM